MVGDRTNEEYHFEFSEPLNIDEECECDNLGSQCCSCESYQTED